MKILSLIIGLIVLTSFEKLKAQELRAEVSVSSQNIQLQSDFKDRFLVLENVLKSFINNRKWTNQDFSEEEKIECSFFFNVTSFDQNSNEYSGSLQIQSSRTAYLSNYTLNMFKFLDQNVGFKYIDGQILEYTDGIYSNELSAVFSFYSLIIIGLDFDSYSLEGGTPYFDKALSLNNAAQSSLYTGWSAQEKNRNNRNALINTLIENRFSGFRKSWYEYHRFGADSLALNIESGLKHIASSVADLKEIGRLFPNNTIFFFFFNAKSWELIDLFSQAPTSIKSKVREDLIALDPFNNQRYSTKLK
jgi:hypothetical protein